MKKRFWGWLWILTVAAICIFGAESVSAAVGKSDHTLYDYSSAEDWPEAPEITAGSAYLIELNSGAVLYSKDGDAQSYPASTTKILTALLVLENCELDEEVTFSYNSIYDIEDGGHHYEFQEGEVLTVSECLQFLLVESVNEVAYALAEHVAGSVDAFAELMNERAAELGATNTHFTNPHGLNDEDHYTTAHDMAMILWGCIQSEAFRQYASQTEVSLSGRAVKTDGFSTYTNHHLMLIPTSEYYNSSVVCGKTGYTSLAGNTLVTYASQGGMDVICIIMQGSSDRFEDTQKLLDYAFDSFSLTPMSEAVSTNLSGLGSLSLVTDVEEDASLCLPTGVDISSLTTEFAVRETEEADSVLGVKTWYYQGMEIGSATVQTSLASSDSSSEVSEAETSETPDSDGTAEVSGTESAEADEEADGKNSSDSWNVMEIVALVLLGILLFFLLAILIRLLQNHNRRKRKRHRRRRRY
ncbi:MAG: D-alanyl-D-alanine carboxypeptidase [Lachnospiraceae bacterium]|nr:D-alanyl-D-alanine carboxypeptidase [Lachnospiraceae bacterium]